MKELFGIPMTYIMVVLLAIFAVARGERRLRRSFQPRDVQDGPPQPAAPWRADRARRRRPHACDADHDRRLHDRRHGRLLDQQGRLRRTAAHRPRTQRVDEETSHEPGAGIGPYESTHSEALSRRWSSSSTATPTSTASCRCCSSRSTAVRNARSSPSRPSCCRRRPDAPRAARRPAARRGGQYDVSTLREKRCPAQQAGSRRTRRRARRHDHRLSRGAALRRARSPASSRTSSRAAVERRRFEHAGRRRIDALSTVQELTGHAGQVNHIGVALKGDVRSSLSRSTPPPPAFSRTSTARRARKRLASATAP